MQGSLIAIDPGPTQSAFVEFTNCKIVCCGKCDNAEIVDIVKNSFNDPIVIEMIASYGRPVGAETFETCVWIGKFLSYAEKGERMFRREVTKHLCGNQHKVNDAVVRQRLIDIYSGGQGKSVAIGLKKSPGPLYGVKSDAWQALALGITYGELKLGWKIQ